jgi:aromatic-amino-acid transaminase
MNFLPERNQDRPGDDPIFALNREATQRRAAGEKIINATVGALLEDDGSLAVLPSVVEALREVPGARGANYAPISGSPEFLEAAVQDLLGSSPLASMATAVATPGGTGALRHAVSTFLERNQALVTSSFYWGPYATICDENERALRTFNMFDANGGMDVAGLERTLDAVADAQGRLLVFLNDPCHNPTGYSMTEAEWTAVGEVLSNAAKRVPLTVLADVAYLAYAKDQKSFLAHLAPLAERALVLFAWSASKAFTQYGLRVGALIACTADATQRAAVQRALAYACRGTWSNCNAAGQIAIARCLTDAPLRARVDAERERLRTQLAARVEAFNLAARGTALRYPRYDGGFFVTVSAPDARGAMEKLKARGVFVVPQGAALRVALCSVAQGDVPTLVNALNESIG